jgi:hypothetical protein
VLEYSRPVERDDEVPAAGAGLGEESAEEAVEPGAPRVSACAEESSGGCCANASPDEMALIWSTSAYCDMTHTRHDMTRL